MSSTTPDQQPEPRCPRDLDAWILGSGIASLTSAVLLIQEAHIPPSRIHILETLEKAGEGSVGTGDPANGYDYHAGAMPALSGIYMEKLLALVPSKSDSEKTAFDDLCEFNRSRPHSNTPHTRFLSRKSHALARIDPKRMGMGLRRPPQPVYAVFKVGGNFGFDRRHSAAEFRRCVQWFKNGEHELDHIRPLDNGNFNRHEAIIIPIAQFLESRGVDIRFRTTVTDIILDPTHQFVSSISAAKFNEPEISINVKSNDIVIVSVGSVISGATSGTNTTPPSLEMMEIEKDLDDNWLLWLELSTKDQKFGNAYNFCTRLTESRRESFTVTLKSPEFFDRFTELTGDAPGSGIFVTLKDSSWLLSLSIPKQPMFPDQPEDVQVFWGYAMFPANEGDYVKKPMLECSGQEIMTEILHQLIFPVDSILSNSVTIPCVVPRMSAAFLPRTSGDRPQVIPQGMKNMALIGQFVEIPDEIVGTMDYYVRGSEMAVHRLMGLGHDVK
ncbi:uncharacterized protein N7477_007803 [Penicillium maclennaniae]|uniref:uncharacterized protein n=1 Tax=Penicillium maclennaniae TaxID=1343394 RepID=UPI00253FDF91|nr:uncharacterized protein N7477_007803 [Penicillium maclennaniae]KAJ5665355.1 hypothetical protein N7477_007803 [Penicillium maclennaniae]